MNAQVRHVWAVGAELGEGPVWVARESALWFVDIKGCRLHRWCPDSGEHHSWDTPAPPGFLAPLAGGGFIVGMKTGLHRFEPDTGGLSHLVDVEPHRPDNRLNDGCVSPEGALWFGSMHDPETEASGVLYRLDAAGHCVALDEGYVVTNGPAFSPDGRLFYHCDTARRLVYVFDRPDAGTLANRRVLVSIEDDAGFPDGTAVDAQGCLWVALWGGGCVRRYSPQGKLLQTVRLPCARVTKIAFGDRDLRTAFVTTARTGLTAAERAAQPRAGDLFSFTAPVPGLPQAQARVPGG